MEDITSGLPKQRCRSHSKWTSSDLQVSSSSAHSSNHLIPSFLKLHCISHSWTFSPSILLSSSPFPPKTLLSQQMPPQSPCPAHSLVPKHSRSSHPSALSCPVFSSCTWLNPSFCLGSSHREKACVLKNLLKILPDTYSAYSEGIGKKKKKEEEKTKPQQQMYLRYKQEAFPMPLWYSADGVIWCTLYLHIPQRNSRQCLTNTLYKPVRGCKKCC